MAITNLVLEQSYRTRYKAIAFESDKLQALIERIRRGDESAFNLLFEDMEHSVLRKCKSKLREREQDAEEVALSVFLKIWNSKNKIPESEYFVFWVNIIITHTCIDYSRKRHFQESEGTRSLDVPEEDGHSFDPVDQKQNVETEVIGKIRQEQILQSIEAKGRCLKPPWDKNDLELFLLRHREGLPFSKIALELNLPKSTVISRYDKRIRPIMIEVEKEWERGND